MNAAAHHDHAAIARVCDDLCDFKGNNIMTGETPRKGDWIPMFSGRQFWPFDPRPDEIHLIDVAAGLSKECRWGGQARRFYSVAEHSVGMYRAARRLGFPLIEQRAALFHDTSEGLGLRDIPRPIKGQLANYAEIEAGIMRAVAVRFDFFEAWPMPPRVKALDEAIGIDEELQIMPAGSLDREGAHRFAATEGLGVLIECWLPDQAFAEFICAAAECGAASL